MHNLGIGPRSEAVIRLLEIGRSISFFLVALIVVDASRKVERYQGKPGLPILWVLEAHNVLVPL